MGLFRRRRCSRCGCTEHDACQVLGVPCCWIREDLCSACATLAELIESEDAGYPWLMSVLGEHCGRLLIQQDVPPPMIWRPGE